MLIEYITKTGMFGIIWCILTLIFPFITYIFIKENKKNPNKIISIIPIIIILFLTHIIANEMIGKSKFDIALIILKM